MNNTPATTSHTHVEDHVYQLFGGEKITEQTETFSSKSKVSRRNVQELFLYGTLKDWETYANTETTCDDRNINDLLDELYPYFSNPDYEPDLSELNQEQRKAGEYIFTKFSQTTEKIGTNAIIPKITGQVIGGRGILSRPQPGAHITAATETYGSQKK